MVLLLIAVLVVADVSAEFGSVLEFGCLCCFRNTAATLCVLTVRDREIPRSGILASND